MSHPVRYIVFTLPAIVLAVVICFLFLDQPIAIAMSKADLLHHKGILGRSMAVRLTQFCYLLMLVVFAAYFFMRLKGVRGKALECVALISQSVVFAFFIKSTLQYLFGRYVPRYKGSNVLLFQRNHHLYGLHWLQAGSFPSGHMAILTAGAIAVSLFYPKFKWVAFLLMLVMAALLLMLNYHFLSDLIAGAYLGVTVSLGLFYLNKINNIP